MVAIFGAIIPDPFATPPILDGPLSCQREPHWQLPSQTYWFMIAAALSCTSRFC